MALPDFPTKTELLNLINTYLTTNGNILAVEHKEIETAMVNAIYGGQIGDVKEIACTTQYILENFAANGKANLNSDRYGWAICNGQNGTIDKRGRVSIGYDPSDYSVMFLNTPNTGSIGGAKTHRLDVTEMPPHSHTYDGYLLKQVGSGIPWYNWGGAGNSSNQPIGTTGGLNGVTQAHNNMQPYIVTLFIQRIQTP